jgi:hypothetical protein
MRYVLMSNMFDSIGTHNDIWRHVAAIPVHQHQEKNGLLFWKRWVKVSLNDLNLEVVPTLPFDLKRNNLFEYGHNNKQGGNNWNISKQLDHFLSYPHS